MSPQSQDHPINSDSISTPTENPISSLLGFPNELLLLIAENLDLKDLNSLLKTSHRLNNLLTPSLHRLAVQDRDCGWWIPFPALHWAAWKGHEGLAKLLLEKGFDANLRTTFQGKTALHFAALKGHESIVRLLLDRGAQVDVQDISYGISPLHIAAFDGYESVVRLLLERGANANIGDHAGRTPLVWVARYARQLDKEMVGVFRTLLEWGADVNMRERECGATSLHWAVDKGRKETVKLLMEKGASLTALSDSKETAIDWALRKGDDEMVKLLLSGTREKDIMEGGESSGGSGFVTKLRSLSIASRAGYV